VLELTHANIGTFRIDDSLSESAQSFKTTNSNTSLQSLQAKMWEDDPDKPSHLENLENKFSKLEAQNATIMAQQDEILKQLGVQ
jgi:hypothetical protein